MAESMKGLHRSHRCTEVSRANEGQLITVMGWVQKSRNKGGIIFTALTWLYGSVTDRLSSGPAAKAAPIVSALGIYLAAQCMMGLFL